MEIAVIENVGFDTRIKSKFSEEAKGKFFSGLRYVQVYDKILMRRFLTCKYEN
jgi:hypothetical protein